MLKSGASDLIRGFGTAASNWKRCEQLDRQIEQKKRNIQDLKDKIFNPTTTEKAELEHKIMETEDEISNMKDLEADRAKLQAFLRRK